MIIIIIIIITFYIPIHYDVMSIIVAYILFKYIFVFINNKTCLLQFLLAERNNDISDDNSRVQTTFLYICMIDGRTF